MYVYSSSEIWGEAEGEQNDPDNRGEFVRISELVLVPQRVLFLLMYTSFF